MTVIDSRVIGILAKRASSVTVLQAQNICTDLSEQGLLEGLKFNDVPLVESAFKDFSPVDDYNNDPSPEEVEKLCDEARREGTRADDIARQQGRPRAVDGFTHEEAMEEIKRLRKYEDYVIESGFVLGFNQWLVTK